MENACYNVIVTHACGRVLSEKWDNWKVFAATVMQLPHRRHSPELGKPTSENRFNSSFTRYIKVMGVLCFNPIMM